MVNDFEFHVYNRSALYGQLQELFGLDPTIIPSRKEDEKAQENGRETTHSNLESVKVKTESQDPSSSWRSLIPVIKVNVSTPHATKPTDMGQPQACHESFIVDVPTEGRLAFGNHYQPQTLCINFDDAFLTYTTKPPSSHLDQFMHILKGKLENVRVMLVPSPRYVGLQTDEPPRLMGEGFVVMQSNDVDIYYYMDEPGLVPEETEENNDGETTDEDSKLQDLPPCWGLDIVCGKGTDFNYGPWADRQRDCLWKFFFPPDYQIMKVSEIAQPGKPRQILAFELRMNIIADATIDLLFTKNRVNNGKVETNAVHVNVGAGSYLEINIPMTVSENGYSPAIKGQLLHVDATSSMQYRTLLEAEMLAFHINANYPRIWNMPQTWQCEVEVYKATYHFIFAQKNFFADLIQDWSSDSAPDIFSFVPYIWNFKVMFHQFEMIWAANQHNWIDCSTKQQENVVAEPISPFCDDFKTLQELLGRMAMTLDVHPEEVQEKSHKMMDMLTAAAPARLARFIHDAVLEPTRSSDRHQFLCLQLRKSGEEVLRFEHRYNHHSWAPLEVAVANEKGRQDTGINLKKIEDKKLDLSGKKLYSTGGLQLCIANQHPLLWHYNFIMWDTLSEFKDKLPDKGEDVDLHLFLPDCHPSKYSLFMLVKDCHPNKISPESCISAECQSGQKTGKPKWRNITQEEAGWVECWTVPSVTFTIDYTWHPIYPQKADEQLKQSPSTRLPIDPSELPPDKLHVELEVSPDSQITLYGPLLNAFLFIKENYFGEDDMYTDFEEVISSPVLSMSTSSSSGWTAVGLENDKKGSESSAKPVHPLTLRPWDITVLVNVYKVHGRLPVRPSVDELLREGHISLSGLQLRAHAMFSAEGLPVGSDTLEYAWLIDVQAGCLTAKVTAPQLACLLEWGQMFVFHVMCREFELERPKSVIMCQHGIDRRFCESKMGAVRVANCNLHNQFVGEGISAAIQDFQMRQYVEQVNTCRVGLQPAILRRAYWLEAGSVNLGLITADIALAVDHHSKHEVQRHFLETHDSRIKRLWFLWPDDNVKNKRSKNKCGCLGGCRFFGGTVTGLDFFKLEEMTPSSSSAFSSTSAESDMFYGQSLLQPGEWIITKEIPKIIDSKTNGVKRKDWDSRSVGIEIERKAQHLCLQVPLRSHSSSSSSEENSSSSAALPLLAGEKESPSSATEDHMGQKEFVSGAKREDGHGSTPADVSESSPVSPNNQERSVGQSPLRSPLKRQASVCSTRLGSTKSLTAAFYGDKQPVPVGVQFSSDVSRSDENVLDSPKQRRSFGSFPYTPSADSNSFHQYRSMDSSMSMADSEAYFSAAEEFEPISSDEGPGTYPGRKKRKKQAQQIEYSRGSIYHSVEGPLTSTVHGEASQDPKTLPIKTHASQASFVSAVGGEDELVEHMYIGEAEKTVESDQITSQQPIMTCYQSYLTQFQVVNWSVKHPTNKRTSKSSLHRPLDLDTPTSEESASSLEHLSVPTFKIVKQGLTANALLDRGMQLTGSTSNTPYTPLEKKTMDNTDDETITEEWTLDHPVSQTRTTAIVEIKGTVDVVLTPLVAEALDRYIEAMVHCASTQHPAAIVDDLHYKVLREAVQNSKTTFSENLSSKQDVRGTKTENPATGTTNQGQAQTNLSLKQDNVKIKGLQANVTIPKVNLCLLQASVEETPGIASGKTVTHVSLVALCFDRIATQVRMNRGLIEETSNNADTGRNSVTFDRYIHASKMQPQSSGSLRSNAGAEKGKEIAAKLNVHRVHGQLRGLDTTDIGTCAITAIPFEKSKVLFTLEELDEFTFIDETDQQAVPDVTRIGPSQERWGWIMFECGIENLTIKGGRQSGAVLYSTFGVMGKSSATERGGLLASNNSSDSPTGSGYNTDVSDDNLPCDRSPSSDINGNSVSDEQDEGVESDDLKKDLPLMPPPPDSCSMKLTIKEIWFSFAAPTNMRSPAHIFSRQLNLLSTATPAVGAWLVPIDQLKSSLNRLETEGTLRICAVMGCIMTEALESDGLPALVTLKKGLVALARQWMKFIVVTPAFKGVSLHRPAQPLKPQTAACHEHEDGVGLDNGGGLQSDTSADGAEFEFDAATVSEHTMLLEGTATRPPPAGVSSGPVTGAEIMRKLSKSHTHSDSALKIKGIHPYQSLSYTSGDTATDSPVHVGRSGMPVKESPRKESLLSYLTGSFPSLHNLLEGTPQRSTTAVKSSSLTRTGNTVATDMLSEHPLLSEPSSVSFYNWMSNAVGNRGGVVQESPNTKSGHNSLPTGVAPNLPTIPSASDFNTVLSSDQNTLDGTHSQHSTSQDDIAGVEEGNQGFPAVQLADAQVVFKPLLSHTGIQSQDAVPLCYRMYFGEYLSFSGTLDCLRADIVDSDTTKERKSKRARRQGAVNLPPLEFKPALMLETFSISAVVMEKSMCTPQNSTNALSFHDLNKRYYNTFHCNFTISCQSISQHVDMALVRLIHQFSTMIDDIKATQTDIKLSRYTAGSASPTPTFKTRKHRDFRSSDFSRSSRGSINGGNRVNNAKNKRTNNENNKKESRNKNSLGRSERRTSKVSRKGSKDVVDHMTIHMDDSDSITVSEQSEPSAECWQNMYKLLNFYSLISDPTGILEKSSETFGPTGVRSPTEPACRVVFENEQDNSSLSKTQRKRSLVTSEPQHVTLIVFGIGMVNRTHLEADIGGLTMESELKRIHGSFTLKEKMKDVLHQKMTETCATAHIGGVNIVLLEGITPNIQTVVKCSIAKSQALYSAQRGLKTNNAAVLKVGAISINIPQHPATLHSMMVRSSHQLSKQISDLIRQPSTAPQPPKEDVATPLPSEKTPTSVNQTPVETNEFPQLPEGLEKKPIVLKFSAMIDGIAIGAALLPSLKAEYKMGRMRSHGMTGAQTRFTFELPNHRLRFTSKVSATDMSTIPPSASLNLPPVTMSGKYVMEEHDTYSDQIWSIDELPTKQGYYLQGNYLRCVAEVGSFEHNLTTDLLNHLVFVQKVFMKEVNEVIQKVSGGEQPIPLWNEHDGTTDGEKPKILLYSLSLQFKGIQVTATTPSMRAVRFETGLIELELSNRIQTKAMPGSTSYLKLFGKCQVDLNLALGQIVKHQVYEEAGSDFHQVAYFKTRIGLRNALREEISGSSDREAVLITLNRPIVFAQPVAFDRAVLFWLNYKAAYDNWNEQRLALHKDIHMATKEVVDMLPGIQQTSAQAFGTLFLQLTVHDLGICLPITNAPQTNHTTDLDTGSALVLTIESTLITACSSESLVSKGHFKNFCIRFADGFETSWDDWKPEIRGDLVMNACVVPDGTYEVCSRTAGQAAAESSSAGTWTLNVLWKMCGIDVHMDPNIGKRLNALGNTLTTLTGEEDVDDIADLNSVNIADLSDEDEVDTMSPTIHAETVDYRRQGASGSQVGEQRGRKFVKRLVDIRELNEQAKVIDDLKKLGASEGTINQEIQRYQQLESVAVNDIRRDVRKKLRRSSMRAASLKDKWGLGYKPSYNRSKTISASGRPPLKRMDRASSRLGDSEELPEIRVDAASPGPRVTFNIQDPFPEETELDLLSVTIDGPSHYSSTSEGSCSVFSSPKIPVVFSPSIPFQPEEGRRDDSLSSTSEDSEKEEDHEREKAYFYRKPQNTTRKKATGFAAVHQLFTDRWPTTPANRNVTGTTTERNIDFELDIRVEIDCGKCVLHPTTLQQEHDEISLRRSYDRSSRSLDQESPSKKKKFQTNYASTTHLLAGKKVPSSLQTKPSDLETTVFYIPGVDVKLHYNSKTLKTESPNASRGSSLPRTLSKESKLYGMKDTATPPLSNTTHSKTNTLLLPQPPPIPSAKGKGSGGVKTAKLYAWVALQSLPEEMVISPCLLDFLEKALETIPITPIERNYAAVSSQDEDMGQFEIQDSLEESTASLVSSSTSAYSSFPVDVVVYVRVQPSQIKFSCLPVSRVECMLKLPSLDLVFSSNRGELETLGTTCPTENLAVGGNTSQTGSKNSVNKTGIPGSSGLGSPLGRTRHSSSQSDLTSSNSNSSGLSFTACMSDFSLYVFHPYGAGKQKSAVTGLTPGSGALGNVDEEPTSVTGRKDSLSINLEFVKVSLSRIRRSGGASFFESQSASKAASKMDTTLINISAVCDIGSASFKYDMRRLSEILAFPRAWYRRSIARRLFLGDQTINLPASGPGTPDSIDGVSQHLSPESSRKAYCRTWEQPCQSASFTHMAQSPNVFNEHNTNTSMSPGTANHNLKSPAVARSRSVSDSSVPHRDTLSKTSTPFNKSNKAASQQGTPWETLVVFAMNLKQLNVQMNMSNVMGNTTWTTSGLKSQGRLSVGSNRDREISMSVGLGRSQLDSRGGVVGGTIDVNTLEMVAHISEHPNQQPSHKIQITMGSTEARVDYMGSSILMGIFSNADLKLQDEWKVNLYNTLDSSISDKSEIFVHGDLKWDIFQVMISRSTTPDLIKIGMKLQEFFTQQFDTSKRALSTWGPVPYLPPKTVANIEKSSHEQLLDAAHHRHWPGVLKVVSGGHISLFQVPLPEDGMQFGGSMSLHGNHMTLACFHGPNFRSKSWALFHLEEPNIAFWTEAQKIWEDGSSEHSTYVVQTLDFHLGHNTMVTKPCGALESPMATITKITRRRHENPPHGVASVKEWFNYVTATRNEVKNKTIIRLDQRPDPADAAELNLLRNVDANNTESSTTVKSSSLLSGFRGGSSYNHETETIFALPRMQLDFKSIHVQEPQEPSLQDTNVKPTVECSVVTEFTDHICVTMDAELIMFLHDLVSAYLKEKEKAIFPPRILSTRPGQKSPVSVLDESSTERDAEESITYTTVDWREFMCNTWHLEPTLRLISWTGRKIDPVGVDYILQKLGFHHARTTIPKWLQRGVMDPLDKVLSVLIKKLGTALQDEKEKKGKDKEEH
ncbi:hypothetical protein UY3_04218 [Chelonia mydas]|uniref:Bridge-like lipid transfer protein family member 1 C-terminal domain-containing protein n=1 Tax=Chelonia mydas TaxID=8469 RepID=M7BMV6_CHEMY|nr:hypothetical protein UY3_04218 [Chelonia mydas]